MSAENRPRERLEQEGPQVLSTAELLAIILKSGTNRAKTVVKIWFRKTLFLFASGIVRRVWDWQGESFSIGGLV